MSLAGKLLLATPFLIDPNFYRTVVLMLEHDDEGALGVVLNRPLDVPVREYLEDWIELVADPPAVFSGGPVQPEVALAVGRGNRAVGIPGGHGLQLVDLEVGPASAGVEVVRVFSGYAAWAPGQLEGELEEGAWWVTESEPGDAFTADAEQLWSAVLRRQPGELALFATLPDDPGLN